MRPVSVGVFFTSIFITIVGIVAYFPPPLSAYSPETYTSFNFGATIDGPLIDASPILTSGIDKTTYFDAVKDFPITLDPAGHNNEVGRSVIQQVYESLITYNGADTTTFVPQLATTLPTISEDGLIYTFTIRDGITFHNGNSLTAEDVAYSFQRGILQGGYGSPQYLLTEPLLGAGIRDVSELLFASDGIGQAMRGNREAVQTADPALLRTLCEQVKSHIQADGDTVTFTLTNAWSPFLHLLTGTWASVMDKEWVVENGGWDGDCGTWQNYYAIPVEENPIATHMNATGPFQLERIDREEDIILEANETYWRTEEIGPAWEGGPVGNPSFQTIVVSISPTWDYSEGGYYSRFPAMQAGDVDTAFVEPTHYPDMDLLAGKRCDYQLENHRYTCRTLGNGPFRLYRGAPDNTRTDLLFNWDIASPNLFIGTGQLDGNGIPPNFFTDVHVRRAFAYCFDWNIYIETVFGGEAIQSVGVIPPNMEGFNSNGAMYSYNLEQCEAELVQAWSGVLPTTGFRFQVPYVSGDEQTHTIFTLLQTAISEINSQYQIELVGVTASTYADYQTRNLLPLFSNTWTADVHDSYYWMQPLLVDSYPQLANIPDDVITPIAEQLEKVRDTNDPDIRHGLYESLNQLDYDQVFALRLAIPLDHHYEQRWVISPRYPTTYYYALRKGEPPSSLFEALIPHYFMEKILERTRPLF